MAAGRQLGKRVPFVCAHTPPPHHASVAKIFCDDMCLLRYLRARSYDVDKAEAMLRDTLAWREVYLYAPPGLPAG